MNPANHFVGLTEDHFLSQDYSLFFLCLAMGVCSVMNDFVGLTEDHFLSQIKGLDGTKRRPLAKVKALQPVEGTAKLRPARRPRPRRYGQVDGQDHTYLVGVTTRGSYVYRFHSISLPLDLTSLPS